MLARYELRFAGPISNVPREQPIVVEKAPVDPSVDSLLKIKAVGFCYDSVGLVPAASGSAPGRRGRLTRPSPPRNRA